MENNIGIEEVEILLIEDNLHEAELAIRNLKKNKLANRLVHIDDGEEAVDFIFSKGKYEHNKNSIFNPKLILLDLKLPKISGREILSMIKSDEKTKSIPVVVLTSSNEAPDIAECYKLGANSYIVKPINFDGISKIISELGFYWLVLNKPPDAV